MIESQIKQIPHTQESVYKTFSDLSNIGKVADRIPEGQIKDLRFDSDSISCRLDKVGEVTLRIVDREPVKCVKFQTENSPVSITLWIQMLPVTATTSKMKLTLKAGGLMGGMIEKPLKNYIDKIADAFAMLPFDLI